MGWLVVTAVLAALMWVWRQNRREEAEQRREEIGDYDDWPITARTSISYREAEPYEDRRASFPPPLAHWDGPLLFDLVYGDSAGEVTERRVLFSGASRSYEGHQCLTAYCHLRRADRVFRSDRMISCAVAKTGQVIHDPVAYFNRFPARNAGAGPGQASVMGKARPGLKVLMWIARADNDCSEAEAGQLLDYVKKRDGMAGRKSEAWSEGVMRLALLGFRPVQDEAAGALARMSASGAERALVEKYARKMVRANGKEDPKAEKRRVKLFGA
jgi:hypothetical protein